jgi:hypothetical protein
MSDQKVLSLSIDAMIAQKVSAINMEHLLMAGGLMNSGLCLKLAYGMLDVGATRHM